MSASDPTLPTWVAVDMHGVRARLASRSELVKMALWSGYLLGVAAAAVVVLSLLAVLGLLGADLGATGIVGVFAGLGASGGLTIASGAWILSAIRDPVFQVTAHAFRYNDRWGRFWELPLSALLEVTIEDTDLVVHRRGAPELRFHAAGVRPRELEAFAGLLSELLETHAAPAGRPPAQIEALRLLTASGQRS